MDIFCQRVSSFFFFFLLWRTLVLLQRPSGLNQQQASPKCFCISVGAVKGLSERLYQREDSNTNNLLSKLLFSNCLWTSTAKCRVSSRWISSLGSHLWQFKERGVTDTTTATSHSPVTHNPSGGRAGGSVRADRAIYILHVWQIKIQKPVCCSGGHHHHRPVSWAPNPRVDSSVRRQTEECVSSLRASGNSLFIHKVQENVIGKGSDSLGVLAVGCEGKRTGGADVSACCVTLFH